MEHVPMAPALPELICLRKQSPGSRDLSCRSLPSHQPVPHEKRDTPEAGLGKERARNATANILLAWMKTEKSVLLEQGFLWGWWRNGTQQLPQSVRTKVPDVQHYTSGLLLEVFGVFKKKRCK